MVGGARTGEVLGAERHGVLHDTEDPLGPAADGPLLDHLEDTAVGQAADMPVDRGLGHVAQLLDDLQRRQPPPRHCPHDPQPDRVQQQFDDVHGGPP